jgi:hypothetical protein
MWGANATSNVTTAASEPYNWIAYEPLVRGVDCCAVVIVVAVTSL